MSSAGNISQPTYNIENDTGIIQTAAFIPFILCAFMYISLYTIHKKVLSLP